MSAGHMISVIGNIHKRGFEVQVLDKFYPVFVRSDDYFEGNSHRSIVTNVDCRD